MVRSYLVAHKLSELADRVERVRAHAGSAAELAADRDRLDLCAFNLMLAVQSCADIASHIIADEGWPMVSDLRSGFRLLAERGVISTSTSQALARAVGLRNIVAHGYSKVEPSMVAAAAQHGLTDLDHFAAELAAWVTRHGAEE